MNGVYLTMRDRAAERKIRHKRIRSGDFLAKRTQGYVMDVTHKRHTPAENRADFARVLVALVLLAILAAWDKGDRGLASPQQRASMSADGRAPLQ